MSVLWTSFVQGKAYKSALVKKATCWVPESWNLMPRPVLELTLVLVQGTHFHSEVE